MLTRDFAERFAHEWTAAWNSRDLERVLERYADEVEVSSPLVVSVGGETSGVLRGKAALRAFVGKVLARFPDLRFTRLGAYAGVSSVMVRYRGVLDMSVAETFVFDGAGRIVRSLGHVNERDLAKQEAERCWFWASSTTPIWNVTSLADTLAWFGKLGWRTCWVWGEPATFGAVGAGEVQVFLCQGGQGGRGRGSNVSTSEDCESDQGVWMSVWVDDVDRVHARCVAQGLDVTHPPTNEPWGLREMHLRHPDGHVMRVSCGLGAG